MEDNRPEPGEVAEGGRDAAIEHARAGRVDADFASNSAPSRVHSSCDIRSGIRTPAAASHTQPSNSIVVVWKTAVPILSIVVIATLSFPVSSSKLEPEGG